jgi:outer membrane receptor protein involved in Fe transport
MKFSRFLAVLAMLLLASVSVFAQGTTSGALTGTVTSDGAPLPGATVTVTSPQLIGSRTVTSDANGNYNIAGLPPGDYTVRVELQGLQTVTRNARVTLSGTARVDADLKVSAVTESITVTASAPATLETQEIQTNFDAEMIENLPVARTLLGAVNLAPGVNANGPGGATAISGGFAYDSTFSVDGAVVNEVLRGQPQNLFIEDAIQETTVQTGAISAEFGRFTGGVVTAISKSGGNEFTGSFRDSVTNATWTAQGELNEPRPSSKLVNTYEATLGGYLLRDRLWFFTAGRFFDFSSDRLFRAVAAGETQRTYLATEEERRVEVKLTGQLTQRHTLSGSYFDIKRDQTNNSFGSSLEASALDAARSLPNKFTTFNYNGILTDNLLIEALYAKQDFSFVGSGGNQATPERGTNIAFNNVGGSVFGGFPTFCGDCGFPEERNNNNGKLKASYFLSNGALGTHNFAVGYEFYEDMLKSDNHQSGSDFTLGVYSNSFTDGRPNPAPTRGPNGELLATVLQGSAFIIYWPILESAKGNSFKTQSFFVNDKWDLNENLSFNLGARYDQNKGEDNAGQPVTDDSNISPRLGVTYDVFGNGRLRANASYSIYASKIANGNVGDAASPAGQPSYLYWLYYGPDIVNQPTTTVLDTVFGWFRGEGFIEDRDFIVGGGAAGIQTQIKDSLQSPQVREYTIGVGSQIGSNGFFRVDYQDREWSNFYTVEVGLDIGTVEDPLKGGPVDLNLITNSDDFTRRYKAFLVQGNYRLFNRFNIGGNYTWSTLRGNIEGESAGSGPGTAGGENFQKEVLGYANRTPIGYLNADQRHKVRAWVSYDQPTPVGTFNFSLLQRFDSGTPYSAIGNINPQCATCPANPGYISLPQTSTYYMSKRGEFRTDDLTATDLALNYTLPIHRVNLFFQGEVLNAFNRQAVITPNATVSVIRSVNPFTGTYVECPQGVAAAQCRTDFPIGTNANNPIGIYQKGPNFGLGINATTGASLLPGGTAGSFQLPRTYRFSFGVRF